MTPRSILLLAALGLAATAANAQSADFTALDIDVSGGLSLAEAQAIAPDLTADDFAKFDAPGSASSRKKNSPPGWQPCSRGKHWVLRAGLPARKPCRVNGKFSGRLVAIFPHPRLKRGQHQLHMATIVPPLSH